MGWMRHHRLTTFFSGKAARRLLRVAALLPLLFLLAGSLLAQIPQPRERGNPTSDPNRNRSPFGQQEQERQEGAKILDDSTKQVYGPQTSRFFLEQSWYEQYDGLQDLDTVLQDFHRYNYLAKNGYRWQDLGAIGSALQPIFYQHPNQIGSQTGFHAFDPYLILPEQARYYNTRSPHTDWYYVQGAQQRYFLDVLFAYNVNPNWNVGFEYRRINAALLTGNQIQSRNERQTEHDQLRLFTSYESKNERYRLLFSGIFYNHTQQETGGLEVPAEFTNLAQLYDLTPQQLDNRLADAEVMGGQNGLRLHLYQEYALTGGLRKVRLPSAEAIPDSLLAKPDSTSAQSATDSLSRKDNRRAERESAPSRVAADSLGNTLPQPSSDSTLVGRPPAELPAPPKAPPLIIRRDSARVQLRLFHIIDNDWLTFPFTDRNLNSPTRTDFYPAERLLDNQQVVHKVRYQLLQNELGVKFRAGPLFVAGSYRLRMFRMGHEYNPTGIVPQALPAEHILKGQAAFTLNDRWNLRVEGEYLLFDDYRIEGVASSPWLTVALRQSFLRPTLLQRFYFGNLYQWDNDGFANTLSTELEARGKLKLFGQRLEPFVRVNNINDLVFYDQQARPQQTGEALQMLHLGAAAHFRVGKFHNRARVQFTQLSNDSLFRAPEWHVANSFYLQFEPFKQAILIQLGVDVQWNSAFRADAYMPITQQFHLQDDFVIGDYLYADLFLDFRLRRTRAFLKVSDVAHQAFGGGYFTTPRYMGQDRQLEFGFSWYLFD